MKVLFDHQSFTGSTYGGVSRYFVDLMQSFTNRSDITFELSLRLSNNAYLNDATFSRHLRYERFAHSMNINRAASALNRLYSRGRIRAGQYDVFHPTYYHRYFLDAVGNKPFVITFHDATHERYSKQYPQLGGDLYDLKKVLLQRAARVITISEFSKEEILRFYPIKPEKIAVTYLSTALTEHPAAQTQQPQPVLFPYLLYVGKRPYYKNFDGFFRAIRPVLHRHPDLHLICAGGGRFSPDELTQFQSAGLTKRVHYQSITDERLLALYQHAELFVFPSLNEGFGLPVLEAFSGNCPVALSNCSSLPEVGANAALYFDPENDESIAQTIEQALTDEALRNELRRRGAERLRLFSTDKTAQETIQVYQSLC